MSIKYDELVQLKSEGDVFRYTDRETMLYALGVGFMRDPMNEAELKFVYENDLQTVPTFATVIGWGQPTLSRSNINYLMVVHGEQRLTMHKPLPAQAEIIADDRVVGAVDKGEGKGALIFMEKVIRDKKSGDKLCTLGSTIFARGDGGFGGPKEGAPLPHSLPARAPDVVHACDTRPDQAFLYALSGDRNPLHRDPKIAKMAGYRPANPAWTMHLWHSLPGDHLHRLQIRFEEDRRLRCALLLAGLSGGNDRDRDVGGRFCGIVPLQTQRARRGCPQQRKMHPGVTEIRSMMSKG